VAARRLLALILGPLAGAALLSSCYPDPDGIRRLDPSLVSAADAGPDFLDFGDEDDAAGEPDLSGGHGDAGEDAGVVRPDAPPPGADVPASDSAPRTDVPMKPDVPADATSDLPSPDGPPPIERRCADYARNFCARFFACAGLDMARLFGTEDRCRTRVKLGCDLVDLPGSNWPSRACADAYLSVSCANFNNNLEPSDCLTPGNFAEGSPCADETQCAGRRCIITQGATCGRCGSKRLTGEPCLSNESCQPGLVCASGNRLCVAPGATGTACDPNNPCQAQYACRDGACTPRGQDGAPCQAGRDCDAFNGFGCNGGQGQCRKFSVAPNTCRTNSDGTFEVCADSGFCKADTNTCVFAAEDGQACSLDQGPSCRLPAACIGGKCVLPEVKSACP
jgi:hypothetical protein